MNSTDPDVIDVLTADHREVEDLTDQVTRAADRRTTRDHLTLDTGWQS
jgi:hypothetical protein